MKSTNVTTPFGSLPVEVTLGANWEVLRDTALQLKSRPVHILIDNRVEAYHGDAIRKELTHLSQWRQTIVIANELAKEAANAIPLLYEVAGFLPATKSSALVAIGGGAILNIGGFFASIIGRGIDLIAVPTTPMAIADVAFGSKQALNVRQQKNYIGTYYDPAKVIINKGALSSIAPNRIKINCIESLKQFIATDRRRTDTTIGIMQGDQVEIDKLVDEVLLPSAMQKMEILSKDPKEEGLGRILMIGHHIAHPLEAASSYSINHDSAVALGMYLELQELAKRGVLDQNDFECYASLLKLFDIDLRDLQFNYDEFVRLAYKSKLLGPRGDLMLLNIPRFGELDIQDPFLDWPIQEAIEATKAYLDEHYEH